jgi:prevent-host-death family protein
MAKRVVSASEFRVFFKDLANATAENQDRLVITRHGHKLVALVSQEDLEFLEKHKPRPTERPVPEPVPDPTEGIDPPDNMSTEDIERIYAATEGTEDDRLTWWRGMAQTALWLRRGRPPRMC